MDAEEPDLDVQLNEELIARIQAGPTEQEAALAGSTAGVAGNGALTWASVDRAGQGGERGVVYVQRQLSFRSASTGCFSTRPQRLLTPLMSPRWGAQTKMLPQSKAPSRPIRSRVPGDGPGGDPELAGCTNG